MKTVREGHLCWRVNDELTVADRASLEIHSQCPPDVARVIMNAWHQGFIELGVNFSERELALLGLTANHSQTDP